ncbi:MAG: metallophosphoesterase [Bacteroidota bacterium]
MVELPDKPLVETLFLIGDAGEPEIDPKEPTLALLRKDVQAAGENSTVIFLGDNVYPVGLPKKEDARRAEAELRLNQSIDAVNDLPAKVFFIPGNHDWNHEKSGGRKAVRRMEEYIEERLDRGDSFLPSNACGDPEVVKIDKDFRIIFIDSQWWLHDWDGEKKMNKGCEAKSRQEFLVLLEALLEKYKKDQILLVMHHPFYSNGNHGGHFSVQRNLFPLRAVDKHLWIPLPIIGSIEPVYRKINGTKQDATHRDVRELRDAIHGMLNESFKNVIFAAGHDHNLQYHNQLGHHFIVSGAGSKHAYTRKGLDATFSYESEGYVKLYYYATREVWMEIITPNETTGEAVVQFRKQLTPPKPEQDTEEDKIEYSALPDSVVHVATDKYRVSKFEQFLLGKNYRKVWETPVPAPTFDLQERGLTPIKKGGGNGTNSLRLEDEAGKQFVLRSVVKDPLRSIPQEFRNLKAIRFYTNFNSSNHPYAALPIPQMAQAAGIYYATPELVYLPKQEGLGIYNELFDEGLYFFEQRPSGDRSELDQFGNSEEIIGYIDLLAKVQKNQKHRVDQEWTLKSRLFDIYIHDWDRHDDQWRWAAFDRDGYTLYRPIPRDRDAAFYKFNGFFNKLISTFFMRKFKSMKGDLKDVPGQSTNAAFYDRHFLSEMDREDWLQAARNLQTNLTDEVIEAAFNDWPDTLDAQYGEEIRGYLKQRRDNFEAIAMRQYEFLSKIVNVRGTNDDELFDITRGSAGKTTIKVYELSKKGNKKDLLYERTFYPKETKEIRLYGFGGKDDFKIEGEGSKGILIRIVGGFGKDEVENEAIGIGRGKTS